MARDWSYFLQGPLSMVISQMEQRHVSKSVREFLFDGYEDPLISLADTLPALAQIDIPFDRFGWFYKVQLMIKSKTQYYNTPIMFRQG